MEIHVYRKKPVMINAIQYTGENAEEILDFIRITGEDTKNVVVGDTEGNDDDLYIETLEGVFHVSPDDFVICGVKNEFYPCKPDIFEQTYEFIR